MPVEQAKTKTLSFGTLVDAETVSIVTDRSRHGCLSRFAMGEGYVECQSVVENPAAMDATTYRMLGAKDGVGQK